MIEFYKRLTKNCNSINLLNRVHIQLGNRLTPEEFFTLKNDFQMNTSMYKNLEEINDPNTLSSKLHKKTFEWLLQTDDYLNKIGKLKPEPFIKKRLDHYTTLFTSRDQAVQTKNKNLLVCFTGNAQRMMMPLAVFLQSIDAETTDVILMKDPKKNDYLTGMQGYDESFENMLDRLAFLPYTKYNRVVGMGTSGGALPILMLAHKYAFDAVIAVGVNEPNDPRWLEVLSNKTEALIHSFQKKELKTPITYIVYGANDHNDEESAYAWKGILPKTNYVKIANAKHNALQEVIKKGEFVDLLQRTIFQKRYKYRLFGNLLSKLYSYLS